MRSCRPRSRRRCGLTASGLRAASQEKWNQAGNEIDMCIIETLPSGQQIVEFDEDDELEDLAFHEMVTGKGPFTIMHSGPRGSDPSPSKGQSESPPGSPPPPSEAALPPSRPS